MDRYVLEFEKITDLIKSVDFYCELYRCNEDHWLKVKLKGNDHIFYHIYEKGLLDFLSGKVNMAGLFNNSPGSEFFLYVENKGVKVREKFSFDYKNITSWDKFYTDFYTKELDEFNQFIKDIKNS
ncbi:hypothetical protein N9I98_01115 [Flavobacteriales bacterium]|jgi:hypothetical protein|nr:hypothetical protein [Flavobacteriales bacterium]